MEYGRSIIDKIDVPRDVSIRGCIVLCYALFDVVVVSNTRVQIFSNSTDRLRERCHIIVTKAHERPGHVSSSLVV